RNHADSLAYQAEKTLREMGDKISSGLRSEIEEKIKDVRAALSGDDIARLRSTSDELERTMQRIGQEIYGQAGASADAGDQTGGTSSGHDDSGTIEGEYREV
ncbi:MAG TPA: Hsp70 family protein, partial [Ktedonobacteraceae bacterium]